MEHKQEPCDDAISRKAVLEYIEGNEADLWHKSENELVCQDIKALPPVTPQQKMGRWVEEIISVGTRKVFCSECGCSAPFEHVSTGDVYSASGCGVINKTKFCPNCGAKMSESEVSE
jgi:ribosomal protein S27AE